MTEKRKNPQTKIELPPNVVKTLKYIAIGLITLLLLAYLAYQIYQVSYTQIVTEQALRVELSDEINAVGITIRDETLVENEYSGVIVPAVAEGGKVSKGQVIAYVFKTAEDANAYNRIIEIDQQIEEFRSMETAKDESSSIDKLLEERINALATAVSDGELELVDDIRADITYLLNKRQIYRHDVDDFDERIEQLEAEKSSLKEKYDIEPKTVKAEDAGYFVSNVDGHENELSTKNSKDLTPQDVDRLIDSLTYVDTSKYIGKIADDYKWHLVTAISAEEAEKLKVGRAYTIKLPYAEVGSVRATLESLNVTEGDDRVVAQFVCNYLLTELTAIRSQPIVIQVQTYSGIGVKTTALSSRTDTQKITVSASDAYIYGVEAGDAKTVEVTCEVEVVGVYVLWGTEVVFRAVDVLYSRDGITVVTYKAGENKIGSFKYLKLYDDVIVEGRNLYDGKIIND